MVVAPRVAHNKHGILPFPEPAEPLGGLANIGIAVPRNFSREGLAVGLRSPSHQEQPLATEDGRVSCHCMVLTSPCAHSRVG